MKIRISENIRSFRKERGLTQEQLAEVFGVTVGAVSKWESGMSVPEVEMILELAEFFEVSVDVLLGYEWRSNSRETTVKRIRTFWKEKQYEEGMREAERALKKYPYYFDVVYSSALLYWMKGIEREDRKALTRALELFEQTIPLLGQNTDENIDETSIRYKIAEIYLSLGKTHQALELLKKMNSRGAHSGLIGYTLAVNQKKPEEALPYLSRGLMISVAELLRIVMGYANAYEQKEKYQEALDVLQWMCRITEGLRIPGKRNYFDKGEVMLLAGSAQMSVKMGKKEDAASYLRRAGELALHFDEAPEYHFNNVRFYHGTGEETACDDFGRTAMEGIENWLKEVEEKGELTGLWEEWKHEQS